MNVDGPVPAVAPRNTSYLARPGGRIGYDVAGEGPLVVLVPGMGDLRAAYRFLAPALRAAGYRVACTDLRGHGDSDATFSSYGDEETAADVAALISELAGRRVLLRVAMAPLWAAISWKSYLPKLYAGRRPADFGEYRDQVVASLRRPGYARAFSLTTRTSHAAAEARLADVTAPVLVVMGEQDPDFPDPRTEADWIASAFHGQVVMVPEAGHYPQSQRPDITTGAIQRFLESVPPVPRAGPTSVPAGVASRPDGTVTGVPRRWLRLEGAVLLAGSLTAYSVTGQPWWFVPLALLVPGVFMAGYLRGSRLGAQLYNLAHSTALPAAMIGLGWWQGQHLVLALGLIWLAHVGVDRLLGYGLKYDDHFQHTHLGHLGPPRGR